MRNDNRAFERAMALAALTGLKITLGPSVLATSRRWPSRNYWVMAAMGEMLVDKLGIAPARYRTPMLVPRALAGAWVARESLRGDGVDDPWAAVSGGLVAAGCAVAAPMVRKTINTVLGIPDPLLGLAEDYLALSCATEVTDTPMDAFQGAAREAFDDIRERAMPALQSMGMRP